jgi:hypothetical protein
MITVPSVTDSLNELCEFFSAELNEKQIEIYSKELKQYTAETVRDCVDSACRQYKKFPPLSELLRIIDDKQTSEVYSNRAQESTFCHRCHGCGLIGVGDSTGIQEPYRNLREETVSVGRCHCTNGNQHSGLPLIPMPGNQGNSKVEESMAPWD